MNGHDFLVRMANPQGEALDAIGRGEAVRAKVAGLDLNIGTNDVIAATLVLTLEEAGLKPAAISQALQTAMWWVELLGAVYDAQARPAEVALIGGQPQEPQEAQE